MSVFPAQIEGIQKSQLIPRMVDRIFSYFQGDHVSDWETSKRKHEFEASFPLGAVIPVEVGIQIEF